jgi:SET domain-containing protein
MKKWLKAKLSGAPKLEIQKLQQNNKHFRPLKPYLTVKKSGIEGLGLFADEDIPVGEAIGVTHVEDYRFKDGYIRTATGAFINHSEAPNIGLVNNSDMKYGKALRHIKKGEELTTQYTLYSLSLQGN